MCDGDTHTHSHTYEYPSFLVTASTSNHRCGYAVRYSTSAHVRTYTRISGSSEQKKEKARLFLLLLPQTAFRISLSLFGVTHTHTHTHVYHISTAYVTQTRVFTLRLLISSYVCVCVATHKTKQLDVGRQFHKIQQEEMVGTHATLGLRCVYVCGGRRGGRGGRGGDRLTGIYNGGWVM